MKQSNFILLIALCLATAVADNKRLLCKCHYNDVFYNQIDITCGRDKASTPTQSQEQKPTCLKEVTAYVSRNYEYVPGLGFYKLHRLGAVYEKAQARCRQDGASLAVPKTKAEAQAIAAIIKKNTAVSEAFVGINELQDAGVWASIQGTPLSSLGYREWLPGQPDNKPSEGARCLTINKDGLYSDHHCNYWPYAFVCHRPLSTYPPAAYRYLPQLGFYQLYTKEVTYAEAKQTCLNDGGHLAVLDTTEEAEEVVKLFDQVPSIGAAYVGINDLEKEGVFVTETGKLVSSLSFENWHPDEPNNAYGGENCGSFYSAGTINDLRCDRRYPFICEIELAKF